MEDQMEFEDYDFPIEATDLSKDITQKLMNYFQSIYNIDMSGSFHQYQLIRGLICLKPNKIEMIIDSLLEAIEFIVDTHDSNVESMNNLVRSSYKKRDEALYHFWEYRSTAKLLKNENISFRKKTAYRFSMINQIVENMLKREAYLLYVVSRISNAKPTKKDINLNETIQTLLSLPFEYLKNIDFNNLKNIPINQWRNIAAHSSYECKNEEIEISYGDNKTETLTLNELDITIAEIYSLRLFVKAVVNISLDILQVKYPTYENESRFVPETTIIDLNAHYEKFEMKITSFKLSNSIMFEDHVYKVDGESYFEIEIESTNSERLEVVKLSLLSLLQITKTINEYNSTVNIENIVWVFKIVFADDDTILFLPISFDEVAILLQYPANYVDMIANKLLQSSEPHIKSILKIE